MHQELADNPGGTESVPAYGVVLALRYRRGEQELALFSISAAVDTATDVTVEELAIETCEALAVGVAYSSERIVDRARRFHREYTGPATSYVRDFDDQLRSALLLDGAHVPHRNLIAFSGHRGLPAPTVRLVDEAIRAELARHAPDLTGISCLADGADQIFARAVTDFGGTLEVVLPAAEYREGLPADSHPGYDDLFAKAAAVRRLPFTESTSESHMAAIKLMVDAADELYAVWDGKPARSYGGTADVAAYAREHGIPVRVIWPDGAQRD